MAKKWPRLFDEDCAMVPITPDTTEEEWRAAFWDIKKKWGFRRPKKRTHKGELAFRIQVYDAHGELKNFTQVAQRLRRSESNVRRACNEVFYDIHSTPQRGRIKARRAAGFDVTAHMDSCLMCREAKRLEEMCSAAQAYGNQDTRALRESLQS